MSPEAHPKEGLIGFLRTDFSTAGDPTDRDLVMRRLFSLENAQIGQQAELLLASACISGMGKGVIVSMIQQAHVEMSKIPREISPSALGLDGDGLGIYDPKLSPELEAILYRASLFRIIQESITVHRMGDEEAVYVKSPLDLFSEVIDLFARWRRDFVRKHSQEPLNFEKLDVPSLARQGEEINPDSFLGQVIREAQRLGEGEDPMSPQFSDN